MADEERDPSTAGGKRRRPAPTIDLKATEIASDPVNPTEPFDLSRETPREEAPSGASTAPEAPKAGPQVPPAGDSVPPRRRGTEWLHREAMANRLSAWRIRAAELFSIRLIAAGIAGAAVMLALIAALWFAGTIGVRDDLTVTLAARLAIAELQVRDLAMRPQPAGLDQRAFADLAARVGAAEQALGRLNEIDARIAKTEAAASAPRTAPQTDQALANRVTAVENATRTLDELAQRVDAARSAARDAKQRADAAFAVAEKNSTPQAQAASHGEIEALTARLAALEQSAKVLQDKITATAGADRAARLAFIASSLRTAVERGEPFAKELAASKALAPDAAVLAPLETFAATGVPTAASLARELKEAAPQLVAATEVFGDASLVGRLQQNAGRLVRIRPVNEAPAGDVSGIVSRAEAKAAQGDVAGALAEVTRLPDAARAGIVAWIRKAQLQIAALSAAQQFATSAVDALKAAP